MHWQFFLFLPYSAAFSLKEGLYCIFPVKDLDGECWLIEKAVFANDDVFFPTLCAFDEQDEL